MRFARWIILLLLAVTHVNGAVASRHPYRQQWKHATFGKRAVAGVGAGAALRRGHAGEGFGKRVAGGFGKHVVKTTVGYGVAAVRHEDMRYHPSTRPGFGPRMKHALASTVVTHKTNTGKRTVASGRIAGNLASGFIGPAGLQTAAAGASSAGIAVGADAGSNVIREFWPEIRHPRRHHGRRAAVRKA